MSHPTPPLTQTRYPYPPPTTCDHLCTTHNSRVQFYSILTMEWTCTLCYHIYNNYSDLQNHLCTPVFMCIMCKKGEMIGEELRAHMVYSHPQNFLTKEFKYEDYFLVQVPSQEDLLSLAVKDQCFGVLEINTN